MMRIRLLSVLLLLSACDGQHDVGVNDQSLGAEGKPPKKNGTCNQGLTVCNGICRNLQTDAANCGACGNACPMGHQCVQGACKGNGCGQGLTQCGNACVNLQTDAANCGACGQACAQGQQCTQGNCVQQGCGQGLTQCGNACVDLNSDPQNCGACGFACA